MAIPRVKGKRREVRRVLARYRRGEPPTDGCPLRTALRPAAGAA